jgi:hypothetical protein
MMLTYTNLSLVDSIQYEKLGHPNLNHYAKVGTQTKKTKEEMHDEKYR